MSGICGGHLGGQRDLTDAQDRMYQRQIDRIRAEEARAEAGAADVIDLMHVLQKSLAANRKPKAKGRRPRTQAIAKADKADGDA